jgi:hypothetical protein
MAKPTITREIISAAETVFLAMAAVATVRPIVEHYKRKALEQLGYPGYELKHTYLLPDAVFKNYLVLCNEVRKAAGLHAASDDHCPLLVAEHDLCKAQGALVDLMEPIAKLSRHQLLCSGMKNYQEYIDITLRLLAPYVDKDLTSKLAA